MLAKVQKLIADGNTDLSLDDLLNKAQVTENEYTNVLEVSCRVEVSEFAATSHMNVLLTTTIPQ